MHTSSFTQQQTASGLFGLQVWAFPASFTGFAGPKDAHAC
jgi:hypothetical protein